MVNLIHVSYTATLIISLLIFFWHRKNLNKKKKSIGPVQAKWSTLFNLSFPRNWLRCSLISAYLLWNVYWLVKEPASNGPHFSFMLLAILLSFAPRWNVYFGSQGMILNMKVILWKNIKEKEIISRGRRKYLLMKSPISTASWQARRKIPLPQNARFCLSKRLKSEKRRKNKARAQKEISPRTSQKFMP